MSKKLYMLYAGKRGDDPYTMVPGLFQWSVAFEKFGKGGVMSADIHKHSLENFDVVHVNYTPGNDSYIAAIRNALGKKSDTKIIANVDFATGMWNRLDPYVTKSMLEQADMVFHVESNGANRIRRLLSEETKNKVFTIPHPVNTKEIQRAAKTEREPVIACQYHRYMDSWQDYWWGLMEIRKQYPDYKVILMNYTAPEGGRGRVPIVSMFDEVIGRQKYFEYIKMLSNVEINIDITSDYTYGRGVVDAAALGVPTIGSCTIEAMKTVFKDTMVYPGMDAGVMQKFINLQEPKFYEAIANNAMRDCHSYSLENSYNRMVDAICECC